MSSLKTEYLPNDSNMNAWLVQYEGICGFHNKQTNKQNKKTRKQWVALKKQTKQWTSRETKVRIPWQVLSTEIIKLIEYAHSTFSVD